MNNVVFRDKMLPRVICDRDSRTMYSSHHTDLRLFAGACRADEHLQLDSELLIFAQNLIELLHEVLGFSSVWQIL